MHSDEEIRRLQRLLRAASRLYGRMPCTEEDGIYGSSTRAAVIIFQQICGLPVTGEADAMTMARLIRTKDAAEEYFSEPAGISPFRRSDILRIGSSGSAVSILQIITAELAGIYENIPPPESSGIYGPMTAETVKAVQSAWGLVPNGVTDIFTWNRVILLYNCSVRFRCDVPHSLLL